MGFIRDNFGTISIESRRESFYIHAGYGYTSGRRKLSDLPLRTEVVFNGTRHIVSVIAEDYVALREQQFSTIVELSPKTEVEAPGYEEDAEGSFAEHWRGPHPEFLLDDLDDLIAALKDLRESEERSS